MNFKELFLAFVNTQLGIKCAIVRQVNGYEHLLKIDYPEWEFRVFLDGLKRINASDVLSAFVWCDDDKCWFEYDANEESFILYAPDKIPKTLLSRD